MVKNTFRHVIFDRLWHSQYQLEWIQNTIHRKQRFIKEKTHSIQYVAKWQFKLKFSSQNAKLFTDNVQQMTIGNPSVTLKNPYLMGSELYYLKIGKYGPINFANILSQTTVKVQRTLLRFLIIFTILPYGPYMYQKDLNSWSRRHEFCS